MRSRAKFFVFKHSFFFSFSFSLSVYHSSKSRTASDIITIFIFNIYLNLFVCFLIIFTLNRNQIRMSVIICIIWIVFFSSILFPFSSLFYFPMIIHTDYKLRWKSSRHTNNLEDWTNSNNTNNNKLHKWEQEHKMRRKKKIKCDLFVMHVIPMHCDRTNTSWAKGISNQQNEKDEKKKM